MKFQKSRISNFHDICVYGSMFLGHVDDGRLFLVEGERMNGVFLTERQALHNRFASREPQNFSRYCGFRPTWRV